MDGTRASDLKAMEKYRAISEIVAIAITWLKAAVLFITRRVQCLASWG